MDVLESHVDPDSDLFKTNAERMAALVADLRARTAEARQGGGPRYLERHRAQGKLPVRERIDKLLDPGSPFLELSPLAASDLYDNEAPAATSPVRERSSSTSACMRSARRSNASSRAICVESTVMPSPA